MVLLAIQITHFVLTELSERSVTPFSVPKTLTSGKAEDVPKLPAGNPVNGVAAEGGEPQGAAPGRRVLP